MQTLFYVATESPIAMNMSRARMLSRNTLRFFRVRFKLMWKQAYSQAISACGEYGVRRLAAAFGAVANPGSLKREQAPALQITPSLTLQFHISLNHTRYKLHLSQSPIFTVT